MPGTRLTYEDRRLVGLKSNWWIGQELSHVAHHHWMDSIGARGVSETTRQGTSSG